MKYKGTFAVQISLLLLCCTITLPADQNKQPLVNKGILDLSDWKFSSNSPVRLDGEWEFYWQQLLPPENFSFSEPPQPTGYLTVPGSWLRLADLKTGIKDYGYATLRLCIKLKEKTLLGLKLPFILTAYKLWVNKRLLAGAGEVGTTAETSRPMTINQVIYLDNNQENLELVLQISNFDDLWGGTTASIYLGSVKQIQSLRERESAGNLITLGAILIFGLYHFGLFLIRKHDPYALFLGFYCLLIGTAIFCIEQFSWSLFTNLDWEIIKKIGFIIMIIGTTFFLFFITFLYPKETCRTLGRIIHSLNCIIAGIVILTPFRLYVKGLYIYHFVIFFACLYILIVLLLALYRKREGSLIVFIGYSILLLATINDILFTNDILHTGMTLHYGLFAFMLTQALFIALRFSRLFTQVENLSCELQQYSGQLELKVKERTLQLEEASTQRTNFFIHFTHETKTPLTLILNYLEKDIKQRGLSEDIRLVEYNLKKLKQDMVNFLELEKLNRKQPFYNHEQVINLSSELRMKALLFGEIARQKMLTLTTQLQENLYIKIDPDALERVFNNLLDNAIKFTPGKGEIHLELTGVEDIVSCTIRDTGIGIPPHEQKKIFEPYYQISCQRQNKHGIGMGLAIVKKIMDEIAGEIQLVSTPGDGTAFTLGFKRCFPAIDTPVQSSSAADSPLVHLDVTLKEELYAPGKPTLFIIDDNEHILYYLQSSLERDYNIFYATNGQEALDKLKQIPLPNLIISDIMMDRMNGYELLEQLGRDEGTKQIPIIFLSAKTTEDDKLTGFKKGAIDYIYKPFVLEELKAKIDALIKQQANMQEAQFREMEKRIAHFLRSSSAVQATSATHHSLQLDLLLFDLNEFKITPKEKQIIDLLVKGFEYKEIGVQLNIALNTLKPYVNNIYRKLNVHNKVELINFLNNLQGKK